MFGINRKHKNGAGSMVRIKLAHFDDSLLIKYFGTEFHKERSLTELNWELVIFLRVTFSGLHREKLIAFFAHFLIEARVAKNKHPTFTDKRLDTRVSQCDTQMINSIK